MEMSEMLRTETRVLGRREGICGISASFITTFNKYAVTEEFLGDCL